MLDVGCGSGRFLAAAAASGWQAIGLDLDEKAVAQAAARPGVDARVGRLVGSGFAAGWFDAVTMDNAIEHLPDPAASLAEAARILRPGGRLVAVTPNLDSLGHRAFGQDWRGLEPPRHLFLFTAGSLRRLARRAGFARVEITSSAGRTAGDWPIIRTSIEAARAAGRAPPDLNLASMARAERLYDLAGLSRGEWVILVAER